VSYGHFFQIPNFEYLYKNPEFELSFNKDYSTTNPPDREVNTIGNAEFKPERTVIYEMGVQQQIGADYALGATGFFKDIRNLNGTEVFYTANGIRYGRYVNLDIGNVRGFTLSFERRLRNGIGATLDYTYQVAKGTASDPSSAFLDAEAGREPEKQLLPVDWDRPNSLNISVTTGIPDDYSLSLIGRMGNGLPYTPERESSRVTVKNSERKPFFMTFDLNAFKNLKIGNLNYTIFLRVYNLLDRKNEQNVYSDTGRATYSFEAERSGTIYGVNSLDEYLARPDFFSEPRQVILGISVEF
jgi:outer membrane receptor protein involved in Fe transport